jgi:hypothetical protein
MVYAAACVWLMVIVMLAWGINSLWLSMARARTLSVALLPGTAAAYLARTIALLFTGATFAEGPKDGAGKPESTETCLQPKMPMAGPIIVALVPLFFLGILLYLLVLHLGTAVVSQLPADPISRKLPLDLAAFWEQLRALVTLCEKTLDAIRTTEVTRWQTALFAYLMICLTVRLAPLPGNLKGHILAIILLTIAAVLAGTLTPRLEEAIAGLWPLLCLTVGWLLLLLMASLMAKAAVSSARAVIKWE